MDGSHALCYRFNSGPIIQRSLGLENSIAQTVLVFSVLCNQWPFPHLILEMHNQISWRKMPLHFLPKDMIKYDFSLVKVTVETECQITKLDLTIDNWHKKHLIVWICWHCSKSLLKVYCGSRQTRNRFFRKISSIDVSTHQPPTVRTQKVGFF